MSSTKPRLAFAMRPELPIGFFGPEEWARLEAVAEITSREAFTGFEGEAARAAVEDADIILGAWGCPLLDAGNLAKLPRLKLLAYGAASLRFVATPDMWRRGVTVTSAVSAMAVPVAEFSYAAITFAGKDIFRLRDRHRASRGALGADSRVSYDRPQIGNYQRRIGIVGASRIGRLVIDMLVRGGFAVGVYDPFLNAEAAATMGATKMDLHPLLAWCDTLSLHAPIQPETRHMIGRAELALLHDDACFINTARGWLVDHAALEAELVSGRLRALIDTPDPDPLPASSPLYDLSNVVLTPHLAGAQGNELRRLADAAIREVERFAAGLPPLHPVVEADMRRIA